MTAGLKCAPEIGPKIRISTVSIAPVGSVLHSSARATISAREPLRHDAGADDGSEQECRAERLGGEASRKRRHQAGAFAVAPCCPISFSRRCKLSWSRLRIGSAVKIAMR